MLERETLLHEVMPSIEELVSDQSQHVRAALGTQISGLAPILGKDECVVLLRVNTCCTNSVQDHFTSPSYVSANAQR